jgi:hypothetical protein
MLAYHKVASGVLTEADDYRLRRWWIEVWSDGIPWRSDREGILAHGQIIEKGYTRRL